MEPNLVEKYDTAVPRYTSYPPVPLWKESKMNEQDWLGHLAASYNATEGLSLYIHLPFCEALCTYCGCNKRITRNHAVEVPYIKALIQEWAIYLESLPERPLIKQLHLGGGTPTFFAPDHLKYLISTILSSCRMDEDAEFSFEVHPASTTHEHLQELYELGFRRVSIGVQDISPVILRVINRQQTRSQIELVTRMARDLGYTSINYDIIYGLPFQTLDNIRETARFIALQRPERIAFYSYAHVPWKSASQRAYSEEHLPQGLNKASLYAEGRELFLKEGYHPLGMDHFCLPEDDLYKHHNEGRMHRNFMGYTTSHSNCLIGLGTSAISECGTAYVQNEKKVELYQDRISSGELPLTKGHFLTQNEKKFKNIILDLMCRDYAIIHDKEITGSTKLESLLKDKLISMDDNKIVVLENGKSLVRNICAAIDPNYHTKPDVRRPVFSRAI